jgi:hypothetical protein
MLGVNPSFLYVLCANQVLCMPSHGPLVLSTLHGHRGEAAAHRLPFAD